MGGAGGEGGGGSGGSAGSGGAGGSGGSSGLRECQATHEDVGKVAELMPFFHGVMGTATIVDDCTIRIEEFVYDGTGIDVRIYSGLDGDYGSGFAMTGDLLKDGGYNGDTLVAQLPEGRTLSEFNGLSVWCVTVGIDFGSGTFE